MGYAILGVSSDATDAEIKRAYRLIAMQCHPDKGGDKEDFQELNNAYEKIMEQRRSSTGANGENNGNEDQGSDMEDSSGRKKQPASDRDMEGKDSVNVNTVNKDNENVDVPQGDESQQDGERDGEGADGEYGAEGSNASLVRKAEKAAEEASRYAKTAAEFSHQAAEAAETARRGREKGSRDTLTKSIAHSAIVLTLTVVKAVRVVGYATLDVATQCRVAAKRNQEALGCAEGAVKAMHLGLEALNAALTCAEVTETTAAELQAPAPAERFVGAAVRASLAAASASNAAMSAAIAAVEGSRECMKAMEEAGQTSEGDCAKSAADVTEENESTGPERVASEPPPREPPHRTPTPEEAHAAATHRLVMQRNNNHKVLQRLNAEILTH